MKRIIMLRVVLATILVSLGGCCWPDIGTMGMVGVDMTDMTPTNGRGYHERR